jgi:hypothetical protein
VDLNEMAFQAMLVEMRAAGAQASSTVQPIGMPRLPYARARLRFWHERRSGVDAREVARAARKVQRFEEESGQGRLW